MVFENNFSNPFYVTVNLRVHRQVMWLKFNQILIQQHLPLKISNRVKIIMKRLYHLKPQVVVFYTLAEPGTYLGEKIAD